jgi:D-amino-acid dehydrogenase
MSTVIIGGGAIGLCIAVELSRRGRDVIVLDSSTDDDGATALSCGWLTMAHSRPLANPGNLRRSLGWLARRNGPLSIRPRPDPALLRWLLAFAWNSRPGADERGLWAMATLSRDALAAFDDLAAAGLALEYETAGALLAYATGKGLEEEVQSLEPAAALGLTDMTVLDGDAARALEPALSDEIEGAIELGQGRVTRPESLLSALRAALEREGVSITRGVLAHGFERRGQRVSAVHTDAGSIAADEVVIAAGVGSPSLAARLRVRVPVQAGRGYAIDLPTPAGSPSHLVELGEASMVVVPFDDGLRLCGTMEIARPDDPLDEGRGRAMIGAVDGYFAGLEVPSGLPIRVASRPMSPDDLPFIGPLPGVANVSIATGHGMLGVTLVAITARVVADQLEGRAQIDARPFAPDRFRW